VPSFTLSKVGWVPKLNIGSLDSDCAYLGMVYHVAWTYSGQPMYQIWSL